MAIKKLGVATEQNCHQKLFHRFVQWGLTFWNLNKHHCFIVFHISIWGCLELCFRGVKPIKALRGDRTVWQNFSLLFDAIDSEKYLGYMIFQVKLVRYVTLFVYKHDRAQSGTTSSGTVYSASWGKTCAGTILPSFKHNWLKCSCDKYNTQRQLSWGLRVHGFRIRA